MIILVDYCPGGMTMPGRHHDDQNYRYGYQGSENDDEISGTGNSYTTHFRQLDVRLGRWWGVDPKANLTPSQSPYLSMGGNPVMYNDPFGDIFRIGKGDKQAKDDVTSIVDNKRNKDYLHFAEDGTVSLNFTGLKSNKIARILKNDKGIRLINDLVNAKDNEGNDLEIFYGTTGETGIGKENPPKQLNTPDYYTEVGKNPGSIYDELGVNVGINPKSQVLNASTTPFTNDGSDFGFVPQDGYDGKVYINAGNFYHRVNEGSSSYSYGDRGNLINTTTFKMVNKLIQRSQIVYHELNENFLRTVKGKSYEEAHEAAGGEDNPHIFAK